MLLFTESTSINCTQNKNGLLYYPCWEHILLDITMLLHVIFTGTIFQVIYKVKANNLKHQNIVVTGGNVLGAATIIIVTNRIKLVAHHHQSSHFATPWKTRDLLIFASASKIRSAYDGSMSIHPIRDNLEDDGYTQ